MARWSGLRARVAANLAAAVSLTFGLLALSSMAILQNSVRGVEEEGFATAANFVGDELSACPNDPCIARVVDSAAQVGLSVELRDTPLQKASGQWGTLQVERRLGDRWATIEAPTGPRVARIRTALTALVACLLINGVALVVIGTVLFERGVVRRLVQLDDDMARVERLELETPLLASLGGDEIGRMAGSLHRMADRLREDRRRTAQYIARLERTNQELREAHEELARSERLATVGRLAAGVAHEIGNPIAAILGYIEVLRRAPGISSGEYLDRIDRETQRVDRIVRDLLDFARPQPLTVAPVSVQAVITAATRLVQPQPRWRSMALEVRVPADLPPVAAQEHYLTQVFVNLLINAADACEGAGAVSISAAVHPSGQVVVEVADDGPGVREEDRARIFDPFFTTKSPGEGAGLGLSISYRLMESFGGTISVRPNEPRGAIFALSFPSADKPATPPSPA